MSYLIDTNVLSELRRRAPDAQVTRWFSERPSSSLYLSVLSLGELRKGIDALQDGERKHRQLDWLELELPVFFAGRILPIDAKVADRWGRLLAQVKRPLPAIDSLLAATALHHGMSLVTRNLKDFQYQDLSLIDPWAN